MKKLNDIKKYYLFRALIKRFILPIIVVYMLDRGLSLQQIALIALVGTLFSMIFEIPSGAVADALGHRKALVIAMIGQAISMVLYLGGTFWWILFATSLYWLSGTLMTGTDRALFFERLQELGRENEHQKLNGRATSFAHMVSAITLLFSSAAYVFYFWLPFVIGIIQLLAAAILISTFGNKKDLISVKKEEGFWKLTHHFKQAFSAIYQTPLLFWIIIIYGMIQGAFFATTEFHQIILKNIGLAVVLFGLVYSLKRLVVMIIAPFVHIFTKFLTPPKFLLINSLILVLYFFSIAITKNSFIIVTILFLGSCVYIMSSIAVNDYVNKLISEGSRATTLSVKNMVIGVVKIISIAFFGWLFSIVSIQNSFAVYGAIITMLFIITFPVLFKTYKKQSTI
jgi:MFS family permease